MTQSKIVPWIILTFFLIAILFSLITPKLWLPKKKPLNAPDYSFNDLTITQLEHGKPIWQIKAKSAFLDKKSHQAVLSNVQGLLYQAHTVIVRIQAPHAIVWLGPV